MRIENSIKNILFGLSGQIISTIMGFVVRTLFIYTLGIEYLGVDGLFTSILLMLSLANLGFDTAMIYSLYKPLANKNIREIQALMHLYQKAYRIIGIVVLAIGLSLLPLLPFLMNGSTEIDHIEWIYLLFLIQSVSSYYFVHKQSIIVADQKNYIINKIHTVFIIISSLVMILLLIWIGNYIIVLCSQVIFRILENVYIAHISNKLYPYLREKPKSSLSIKEKKHFFGNLYSLLLYKLSGVVINGTDNIILAMFVGVASVGMYSNYLLIISTITTLLSYLFHSITASVGNLNVTESPEKKFFIFKVLTLANFWIYGFCTICLWNLFNPFIEIWLGSKYTFSNFIVFAIVLNFFTTGMQSATTIYRDTTGLFKIGKYRPVYAAIINIVVSVFLVGKIGIAGVFIGTVISRLCTYFWFDPYVIYKHVFHKPVYKYFVNYFSFTFLVFVIAEVSNMVFSNIFVNKPLYTLILNFIQSLVIPNVVFYIFFRRTEEFLYLKGIFHGVVNNFIRSEYLIKFIPYKKNQGF
jgi:O-antigen/teichoic acid export membrane protein